MRVAAATSCRAIRQPGHARNALPVACLPPAPRERSAHAAVVYDVGPAVGEDVAMMRLAWILLL
ncbi:hypothetical protein, partial [uncultured Xanthomonas sp.]|uniref:hypothetical protein n=1 Tax=uncultured Xanthomonas sp. TaxID=152831 RepID=UPI0025D4A235